MRGNAGTFAGRRHEKGLCKSVWKQKWFTRECGTFFRLYQRQSCRGLTPEDAAEQLESDIGQVKSIYAAIDSAENPDDIDMIFEKYIDSHVT